jgi:hypothetical protein
VADNRTQVTTISSTHKADCSKAKTTVYINTTEATEQAIQKPLLRRARAYLAPCFSYLRAIPAQNRGSAAVDFKTHTRKMNSNYMKKCYLSSLVICFVFLQLMANAQGKIEWGELQASKFKSYLLDIVGDDSENIYTIVDAKEEYYIECYQKGSFTQKYSKSVASLEINGKTAEVEEVVFYADQFLVLLSQKNKKTKVKSVYRYLIDAKTGERKGKEVKLFETTVKKKKTNGYFSFNHSPNRQKLLLSYRDYSSEYEVINRIVLLLDTAQNVLTQLDQESAALGAKSAPFVYNDGSLRFVSTTHDSISIVSFDADNAFKKEKVVVPIVNPGVADTGRIAHRRKFLDGKGDLIVFGYYTEQRGEQVELAGCFYTAVNLESKTISVQKLTRFDDKFKEQFRSEEQTDKQEELWIESLFHDITVLKKSDGGAVLVAEYQESNWNFSSYDPNFSKESSRTFYGDLIAVNFSPQGDILWANRILKNQLYWSKSTGMITNSSTGVSALKSPDDGIIDHFSYLPVLANGGLELLFNDNPENNLNGDDVTRNEPFIIMNNVTITKFRIELESGKRTRDSFRAGIDNDVDFQPSVSYQQDASKPVYVFGKNKQGYKFGVLINQ